MRKIGSEKEIEDKRKRNVQIIGIFILGVLVLGTVGFGFLSGSGSSGNDNSQNVRDENLANGQVIETGGRWAANLNGQILYFINSPESVKNVSVLIDSDISSLTGKQVYLDSDNSAIRDEITINLGKYAGRISEACYGACNRDLPEKNCTESIIVWKDKLENKVYQEENCIFIEGDLKAVDAFLYRIFELN